MMIFKDRTEAGKKLSETIARDQKIMEEKDQLVAASLLRGGALVGAEIAQRLAIPHTFLAVAKISAPGQEELGIGAVCHDIVHLDRAFMSRLQIAEGLIQKQIQAAKAKAQQYQKKFIQKQFNYTNKTVIVVDDGAATGASVHAAAEYLRQKRAGPLVLALPVAPSDFLTQGFDAVFILQTSDLFYSVSQFYEEFHQVSDAEVTQMGVSD